MNEQDQKDHDLHDKWSGLLFGIRVSIRYHKRRILFYDKWGKFTNGWVALAGLGAVISLLQGWGDGWTAFVTASASVVAVIDLVVGTAKMARTHEILARRFAELEMEHNRIVAATAADFVRLMNQKLAIDLDEPPTMRIVSELSYNEVCGEMGLDYGIKNITSSQKLLANFINFYDDSHATGAETKPIPTHS